MPTLICLLISLFSVVLTDIFPQEPTLGPNPAAGPALPTVEQILGKYAIAIGGCPAVKAIKTRVMKGSLVTPAGTASVEIYEKAPNKFLIIIDSPVSGVSQNGFNGAAAWSQNRQRGLRDMSGPEVENFKREYTLYREIMLSELYPSMSVTDRKMIGDRAAYVVEACAADGTKEVMYFDVITGMLTRRDVTLQGTTLEAYFENYQEVDDVKVPFTIRRSRGDFSFTHKFTEVKHNIEIHDARFEKPVSQ